MSTRKVRVTGSITLPISIELEVEVDDSLDKDEQDFEISDKASDLVLEHKLIEFAGGGVGFPLNDLKFHLGAPLEYSDNLTFDDVEDLK